MYDFSKYIWIVPYNINLILLMHIWCLKNMSQGNSINKLRSFIQMLEVNFVLNSWLTSRFLNNGISHQVSCPYFFEQTGIVKQCHRIIRQLGMTMLFNCGAPLLLWVEAFTIAINQMSIIYLLHQLILKLHILCCMVYNLHLECKVQNAILINGIQYTINSIPKLFLVIL